MADNLYCNRRDVNRWIAAGEITGASRLAASALASSDTITLDGHGLETDDTITFRAAEDGALPAELVEGTVYYAIRLTNATFKVSATAGGAAINLTANGAEVIVHREPDYDDKIEFYSRWADGHLPAHLVPLEEPIHPLVKGIVAQLAGKALLNADGKASALVDAAELAGKAQLERYAAGLPLRGAAVTPAANLATVSTVVTAADERGWGLETIP
jgi:hypothetical protein